MSTEQVKHLEQTWHWTLATWQRCSECKENNVMRPVVKCAHSENLFCAAHVPDEKEHECGACMQQSLRDFHAETERMRALRPAFLRHLPDHVPDMQPAQLEAIACADTEWLGHCWSLPTGTADERKVLENCKAIAHACFGRAQRREELRFIREREAKEVAKAEWTFMSAS